MKDFGMIENMEKKAISGSRRRAQLLFACVLLCLGGALLFLKTGLRELRYRVAIHG